MVMPSIKSTCRATASEATDIGISFSNTNNAFT